MQVLLEVPDQYALEATSGDLAKRFKLYTALLMFQAGQLSAGAACELAGVDRYAFLAACKRHRIDAIDYDNDELEGDFEGLKKDGSFIHADRR